jgi:hypothetical protein
MSGAKPLLPQYTFLNKTKVGSMIFKERCPFCYKIIVFIFMLGFISHLNEFLWRETSYETDIGVKMKYIGFQKDLEQ